MILVGDLSFPFL